MGSTVYTDDRLFVMSRAKWAAHFSDVLWRLMGTASEGRVLGSRGGELIFGDFIVSALNDACDPHGIDVLVSERGRYGARAAVVVEKFRATPRDDPEALARGVIAFLVAHRSPAP